MRAPSERLSILQAARVVARRDFLAILFSRAFFWFLIGPLFPLGIGALAGIVGEKVESGSGAAQVGIAMTAYDTHAMLLARKQVVSVLGPDIPEFAILKRLKPGEKYDAQEVLRRPQSHIAAVLTGTLAKPELTATPERIDWWRGPIALIALQATGEAKRLPEVVTHTIASSGVSEERAQRRTGQAGQLLLFLVTMFLAGMVLSNLVEEKANKIIEVLAASIPMDAVFLGKLFAMLAVSLVGMTVWGSAVGIYIVVEKTQQMTLGGIDFTSLPVPAVGWPTFIALGIIYFGMLYLLVGSVLLAIGSLATTVREVQTLSMPVTMMQIPLFFLAALSLAHPHGALNWSAAIFPFTSPYAMVARAAMEPTLWPHAIALAWQALCVAVSIRLGAALFRKRVMHSGPRRVKKPSRRQRAAAEVAEGRPAT